MKRTTLFNAEEPPATGERGRLKLFFTYASFTGTTTAMLDELRGLTGMGKDVLVAEMSCPDGTTGVPFDVDHALKRRPDLVAVDSLAQANPPEARNRWRWQDVAELLHAGIDVYATLHVSELDNERERASIIANRRFEASVPDRLFYNAQQVEFVDIDPQELVERCRAAGRDALDLKVLRQLRLLALQCISQYAASTAGASGKDSAQAYAPRDRVVAVVSPGESPTLALREAAALAGMVHAPLQALCVRREARGGRAAQGDEGQLERLAEQVEAMGFELVVLYGSDAAETVRDFARAQGVSDIVVVRRPLSLSRHLLLPVMPSFADRVGEGLLGVRVHVVSDDVPSGKARFVVARGLEEFFDLRPSGLLTAVAAVGVATLAMVPLSAAGFSAEGSYLVYLLVVTIVAALTKGYVPSLLAAVLSGVAVSYLVSPVLRPGVDPAALVTFVLMAVMLLVVALAMARMGRMAERARAREQHTQALYELSRSLLYARGQAAVVDVSLDALTRLFGRSAVFYVSDPLAPGVALDNRKCMTVRAVPGDFDAREFSKVTERAVAHWVFANGAPAGSGTGTSETSDIRYLPLLMDDEVIGVVGVSARRPMTLGEESFLGMVCDQVLNALERQALSASHLRDMRSLRVGGIRDDFMGRLVASVNQSAATVSEVTRMLQSRREPSEERRELLEQVVADEALRTRTVMNKATAQLADEADVGDACELRSVVARAVERARDGHGSTVLELEPGDATSDVLADATLIGMATSLILEASLVFAPVGSIVSVSVREHPERVTVSVADDRPDPLAVQPAAFSPRYDAERSHALVQLLGSADLGMSADAMTALARALRVPLAACMVDGKVDARRLSRMDRVEYGLHVAAMVVAAHGGEVKMRHRLGGGAVTSFSLPRG